MKYGLLLLFFACKQEEDLPSDPCIKFAKQINSIKEYVSVFNGESFHYDFNLEPRLETCNDNKLAVELSVQKQNNGYYDCDTIVDFSEGVYLDIAEIDLTDTELQVDINNQSEELVCMKIYWYWEGELKNQDMMWSN